MRNNISGKTEYIYADYFRLICAIGIVALHLDPFYDINEYANFFVGSVLTRLCVPFFFLLSGFFLKDKLSDWSRLSKYVWHLVKLYIIYTILYLPVIFHEFRDNGESFSADLVSFIKKFFFVGSYGQLWYFLALIFAVIFLYLLKTKCKIGQTAMIVVSILLFLTGAFFRVYDKPIRDIVDEIKIVALYDSVFKTTKNGLFFGLPFVYAGNLIWEKNICVDRKKYGIFFGISMVAFTIEAILVRKFIGARQLDMLLLLPITSILFVLLILSKNVEFAEIKKARSLWCRKLSVHIFGLHLLIYFIISRVTNRYELRLNNMVSFMLVLIINLIVGFILQQLIDKYKSKKC